MTEKLFEPMDIAALREGSGQGVGVYQTQDGYASDQTSLSMTASFKYDPANGVKSTQQLNVDWTDWAAHTFFNSAQVKTNVAFEKIFNEYPFDGTQAQVETFLDRLTGFERYVYDNYIPKHTDYLIFSGTVPAETTGGTYVITKDLAGAAYPTVSTNTTGTSILSPMEKPMTIEFHVWVPEVSSSNQVIVDKHVDSGATSRHGFMVSVESTGSSDVGLIGFYGLSGSMSDRVLMEVEKGQWNHVAWVWDKGVTGTQKIFGYLNQELVCSSAVGMEMPTVDCRTVDLLVGSGSSITGLFTPETTFSGSIDELRIWHTVRTDAQRANFERKSVFADTNLKLYYRFNEPAGIQSNIVTDYSNNSLHGRLSAGGIALGVRDLDKSLYPYGDVPMWYEKHEYAPILFPDYSETMTTMATLLVSAEEYDKVNPNLITRLLPPHYLQEGQIADGLYTQQGAIVDAPTNNYELRSSTLGGTQALLLMLYVWAKFFDEIKLYTQSFSSLDWVDYDQTDTAPDVFLQDLAKRYGLSLPPLFQGSSIEQYVNAENIGTSIGTNELTLRDVQNQIWRRILINMQDFLKSKGTLHSVKSFIRTVGIDPDSVFRIREYGGPDVRSLSFTRDRRTETSTMLSFVSGGFARSSKLMSGSKNEPGYPLTGSQANEFLTSGSFTWEGIYRFSPSNVTFTSQSLVRLEVEIDSSPTIGLSDITTLNVVAVDDGSITLYARNFDPDPMVSVTMTDANIFDGNIWNISFGRVRGDDLSFSSTERNNAIYFLRAARSENGDVVESYVVTASRYEYPDNIYCGITSGSTFVIGSGSIPISSGSFQVFSALSTTASLAQVPDDARYTDFNGYVGHMRWWSKYVTPSEWNEHVRNYRSVGVESPRTNFNFVDTASGSWQRLRLDVSTDQETRETDGSGNIDLFDFSQNSLVVSGTGFPANTTVIVPQKFYYSYLSPKYDEASCTDKVRVRGFQNEGLVEQTPWAELSPVNSIVRSEQPMDNDRFSIDFSVADALNQDIMTIFGTLDELDTALGSPELLFSSDYPDLAVLRDVYFNKLVGTLNIKGFFEFFKWFDTNIGTFVAQLLPRKTKFLGTSYVVESHAIERHKVEHRYEDIYLGDSNRNGLKDTILLQLITGEFTRY